MGRRGRGLMLASKSLTPLLDSSRQATLSASNQCYTTKKATEKSIASVGLPGFEPRMTGPESVVLPLHHSPLFVFDDAKVELIFGFAKKIAIFFHIFVKIFA